MIVEICCGSFEDGKNAAAGGADRIELNSALFLGGLTPSLGTLIRLKEQYAIETVCMVRPRGAGFCYSEEEFQTMLSDAGLLLQHGGDGIAFGFLREDMEIDMERTKRMNDLILSCGKIPVFHRAFDVTKTMDRAAEQLLSCGCKRILTSGGHATALEGIQELTRLQKTYGKEIDFVAGSGVNENNAAALMRETKITQLHSSCRDWKRDCTTIGKMVSYAYGSDSLEDCYDYVSLEKVKSLMAACKGK